MRDGVETGKKTGRRKMSRQKNGPFHRPRPLPGLRYFSCLHVRPCLTNKWRKWRENKRKHRVFQDIIEITHIINDWM